MSLHRSAPPRPRPSTPEACAATFQEVFGRWKADHGVAPGVRVFVAPQGAPSAIIDELESRGWFYNREDGSPFFDLCWTKTRAPVVEALKAKREAREPMTKEAEMSPPTPFLPWQVSNHYFLNSGAGYATYTSKLELIKTLRHMRWFTDQVRTRTDTREGTACCATATPPPRCVSTSIERGI